MSALTSLLVRDGVVPVRKIEEALQRQVISGGDVETVLLEMNAVPENVLAAYRAAMFELGAATRADVMDVPAELVSLVPGEVARGDRVVPMRVEDRVLHLASREPLTAEQEERLGFLLGYELSVHIACEVRIAAGLAAHYGADLSPRMARLVARVAKRPAGELPRVRSMRPGPLNDEPNEEPTDKGAAGVPGSDPPGSGAHTPNTDAPNTPGSDMPAERPPTNPPERSGGSEAPTAIRRHRGPLTLDAMDRELKRAQNRDEIVDLLFAYAAQFFDYTALFVVHGDSADGREAHGVGAASEELQALSVSLSDPSAFGEALRTRVALVTRLDQSEADRRLADGMRRPGCPTALVMPVTVRTRVVLVLYGDRDGEHFDIGDVMNLVRVGARVTEAFEQLIIRKKRSLLEGQTPPAQAPARRASSSPAAQPSGGRENRKVPMDAGAWKPGRRSSPGFEVPSSGSAQDDRWGGVRRPGRDDARTQQELPAAPQAIESQAFESQAIAADRAGPRSDMSPEPPPGPKPPGAILGIPRSAPPPPQSAELDLSMLAFPDPDDEDAPDLVFDDDDEPELTFEDDDGPDLVFDDSDDPDLVFEDSDDPDLVFGDRDDPDGAPDEAEVEPAPEPPEVISAPPRSMGVYSMSDAPVDVVSPRRRSDRPSRPPSRPPSKEQPSKEKPSKEKRRSGRPGSSAPPATGMDNNTRSVIVDMGEPVREQVDALLLAPSVAAQEKIIRGLLETGEAALPILAQAFPGPLAWTRESGNRVPRAAELSPIARALVAFGVRSAPYVGGLLSSGHPDVRLYAGVVASEMISAELLQPVAERIYDDDAGVRRIAVQLLPRFAAFRGFEEVRTMLRRGARIRGRDLTRRWKAVDALAAIRDVEMIPKMIELFRADDDELTRHLAAALTVLTGASHGTAAKKWDQWWKKNRSRHRIEWLIDALNSPEEAIRQASAEELKRLTQQYYGYHAGSPRRDRERIAKKYREWWEEDGRRLFA